LDYVFGGVNVSANITFAAGTAVGWYELPGSGGPGYGLGLKMGVTVAFNGTGTQPCNFAIDSRPFLPIVDTVLRLASGDTYTQKWSTTRFFMIFRVTSGLAVSSSAVNFV
jgi:hypothetical protein